MIKMFGSEGAERALAAANIGAEESRRRRNFGFHTGSLQPRCQVLLVHIQSNLHAGAHESI